MRLPGDLEGSLATWLPRQRWFAGKGREVDKLAILTDTTLIRGDPGLHHVIAAVHQDGIVDRYQLLIGLRSELPRRLEYAEIDQATPRVRIYDAVHDPELTRVLLEHLAAGSNLGALSFHTVPGTRIETELVSLASTAEQSNTSLIFGETYICKLFRRIAPGINPDLELNLGLTKVDCAHIPKLHGWIEDDAGATLAMLSEYLPAATDGWRLATASVRDLLQEPLASVPGGPDSEVPRAHEAGGDFAGEAERLGAATAAVHRDLAQAFGITELPAGRLAELAEEMHRHLHEAIETVPALAAGADRVRAAFDALAQLEDAIPVQPVHGDYHLGQVLRTGTGWVVLDFEGEPARPAHERRAPAHPLKDVAGMLRSFEYAALYLLYGAHGLLGSSSGPATDELDTLELRAREWADRNRAAFCRGYAGAGGPDPAAHAVLLRAFEYDKAVYEVLYEARNRPSWLRIPLGSLTRPTT